MSGGGNHESPEAEVSKQKAEVKKSKGKKDDEGGKKKSKSRKVAEDDEEHPVMKKPAKKFKKDEFDGIFDDIRGGDDRDDDMDEEDGDDVGAEGPKKKTRKGKSANKEPKSKTSKKDLHSFLSFFAGFNLALIFFNASLLFTSWFISQEKASEKKHHGGKRRDGMEDEEPATLAAEPGFNKTMDPGVEEHRVKECMSFLAKAHKVTWQHTFPFSTMELPRVSVG